VERPSLRRRRYRGAELAGARQPQASGRLLPSLLFLSGMTSLVFQVSWLRGFSIILGSTIYSMSCVITVFMLGLGIGSFSAARLVRAVPGVRKNPLLAYGIVELLAGITSLVITSSLFLIPDDYIRLVTQLSGQGSFLRTIVAHCLSCLALVGIPTVLMGMTLPIVSLTIVERSSLPRLYGMNTLGAAAGSLLASFVLIYYLGCIGAAAAAAGVNVVIFATCWLHRRHRVAGGAADRRPAEAADQVLASRVAVFTVAIFSGFSVLSLEIAWTRYLSLVFGNRIYVTSITLFIILACMGQAARLTSKLLSSKKSVPRILLVVLATSIVSLTVAVALERYALGNGRSPLAVALFVLTMIVLPTSALGVAFPVTLAAQPRQGEGSERLVGLVYGVNTIASVAGSLSSGYVLMDALGTNGILFFNCVLLAVGMVVLLASFRGAYRRVDHAIAGLAVAALALGLFPRRNAPPPLFPPEDVLVSQEDAHGVFNVVRSPTGLRAVNNTTDLVYVYGTHITRYVQETQAYVPALFAADLEAALNIGVGYGITVGGLTRIRQIRHIDAVEIVPALIDHAALFSEGNYRYYDDPRVTVHVTDGRHFLATSPSRYDIMSVNLTDPYLPGCSSFFSKEFYDLARSRLKPGGVFCQQIFGPDVVSLYHGIKRAFPFVEAVPGYQNGLSVIAGTEPLTQRQRELFRTEYGDGGELFGHLGIASLAELDVLLAEGRVLLERLERQPPEFYNSDVFPVLEFRRAPDKVSLLYSNQ
jgi:spermidine synthase